VGRGGEWHIDPYNIEIVASGPDFGTTGENAVTSNATGAHISANTIVNALDNGINVSLTTGTGAPATDLTHGDITVSAAINKTGAVNATLTLNANNNIIINAPITSSAGRLDLNLNSNYQENYPAADHAVRLNANLSLNGGALTVSESGASGSGTLNIAGGTTSLTGGSAINAAAVNVLAGATLSGAGTVSGTLSNNGTVSPGGTGAIGRLTVQGNYTQGSTGVLNIELRDTDGFDQLATDGTASLNGKLSLRSLNGFVPPLNSTFDVVTAQTAGSSGNFNNIDAPQQSTAAFPATLPVSYPGAGTAVSRITVGPSIPTPVVIPTPTLPPSADICTIAPNSALCQVLAPRTASAALQPVSQALNSTVNVIVAKSTPFAPPPSFESTPEKVAAMPVSIPAAGSTAASAASGDDTKSDDAKKSDVKEEKVAVKSEAKSEKPPPKTFCN
jgi:hypothetical protein